MSQLLSEEEDFVPSPNYTRHCSIDFNVPTSSTLRSFRKSETNFEYIYNSLVHRVKDQEESNQDILSQACKFPFFESLTLNGMDVHSISKLFCKTNVAEYRKNSEIFRFKDGMIDRIFFILKGEVEILPTNDIEEARLSNFPVQRKLRSMSYIQAAQTSLNQKSMRSIDRKFSLNQVNLDSSAPKSKFPLIKENEEDPKLNAMASVQPSSPDFFHVILNVGQSFGELDELPLSQGVLYAKTDCKVFWLEKRDIEEIKQTYSLDSLDDKLPSFLLNHIPGLPNANSFEKIKDFSKFFTREKLKRGNILTVADQPGDTIYLLKKGQVKASLQTNDRKIRLLNNNSEDFLHIEAGGLIGDELLFEEAGIFRWSMVVTSGKATIYKMPVSEFLIHCPRKSLSLLKSHYQRKLAIWAEIISKKKVYVEKTGSFVQRSFQSSPNKSNIDTGLRIPLFNKLLKDSDGESSPLTPQSSKSFTKIIQRTHTSKIIALSKKESQSADNTPKKMNNFGKGINSSKIGRDLDVNNIKDFRLDFGVDEKKKLPRILPNNPSTPQASISQFFEEYHPESPKSCNIHVKKACAKKNKSSFRPPDESTFSSYVSSHRSMASFDSVDFSEKIKLKFKAQSKINTSKVFSSDSVVFQENNQAKLQSSKPVKPKNLKNPSFRCMKLRIDIAKETQGSS